MIEHAFSLIPFPAEDLPEIVISGSVARDRNVLTVQYSMTGDLESISIPATSPQPSRRDNLWTSTCFEFFLAIPGRPEYWEINLSPTGDWNIYHMDSYRRAGFREERRICGVDIRFRYSGEQCIMDGRVDLNSFIPAEEPIQAGITSVVQTVMGSESYWALVHPAPQADFHLRESFLLSL